MPRKTAAAAAAAPTVPLSIGPPTLSPKQKLFFLPAYNYLQTMQGPSRMILLGGRRVGKSYGLVNAFIPTFFSKRSSFAYGAGTDKTGLGGWREITEYCSDMIGVIGKKGWRFAPAEEGLIKLPNGSTWDRLSFGNNDAGRSLTFDGAHVDEIQLIAEEGIMNFLPTLATTRGFAAFSGTVPKTWKEWQQSQWWLRIVQADAKERAEKWPEYVVVHVPTNADDMAFQIQQDDIKKGRDELSWPEYLRLGTKEMNKLRADMGPERYKREVDVIIEPPTEGAIWTALSDHNIGDFGYNPELGGEIVLGMDRGWGGAASVILLAQKYYRKSKNPDLPDEAVYRIFKEAIWQAAISTEFFIRKAIELSPVPSFTVFPDPRAIDVHMVIDAIGLPSYRGAVGIWEGNDLVNTRFDQRRIEIDRSCKTLIGQATRYAISDKTHEPIDFDQDTCDALRYMIWNGNVYSGDNQNDSMQMASELSSRGGTVGYGILRF